MWWQLHINTPGTLVAFNGEYMILNLFRVEKESAKYQPLWSGLNILRLSTTKTYGCIPYTQCIIVLFVDNRGTHYFGGNHSIDVIMSGMAFQITGVSSVCSNVCSGVDQRKHQCSASLAFVTRIHRWSVRREMFPFDDVIMTWCILVVFMDVYMTPVLHIARQLPISYMWHLCGTWIQSSRYPAPNVSTGAVMAEMFNMFCSKFLSMISWSRGIFWRCQC